MLKDYQLTDICNIYRPTMIPDKYGEVGSSSILIYSDIKCRITRSRNANTITQSEVGSVTKGIDMVFMNLVDGTTSLLLHVGDRLIINSITYTVDYISFSPGGKKEHHMQIEISKMVTV